MREQEAVRLVQTDPSPVTNFDDAHWSGVDPIVLQSCFDKGFIHWNGKDKLTVTPLGRRSCGGTDLERHN